MNIHVGTWVFPLIVTILAFGFVLFMSRNDGKAHGYAAAGAGVISLLLYCCAVILSLVAWLIYALLR
jgi:hypothetical protein